MSVGIRAKNALLGPWAKYILSTGIIDLSSYKKGMEILKK